MKKDKYILLDWDGNLAKTLDVWLDACRIALEKRGVVKTDEEIAESFGQFTKFMAAWGIQDIDQTITDADLEAKKRLPEVELYPDALEVLQKLHSDGHKLALITTSHRENVEHLLETHSIRRFFDAIVSGDEVEHHKPHPEPLEKGLALLAGDKSSAVMIGDTDKDIGAANNLGIDSILFYPKEHKKFYKLEELKKHNPTYTVGDFREILGLV